MENGPQFQYHLPSEPQDSVCLFFPHWWTLIGRSSSFRDPYEIFPPQSEVALLPWVRQNLGDQTALLLILSKVQQSLLSFQSSPHRLDQWFLDFGRRDQRFYQTWMRLLAQLESFQAFYWDGHKSFSVPLFKKVQWERLEQGFGLEFSVHKQAKSLFTGVMCIYDQEKDSHLHPLFLKEEPLPIERSLWLDLKPYEISIFFDMKEAMFIKKNQVQEQAYSLSVDPKKVFGDRALRQYVQKLYTHGSLKPLNPHRYYPMDSSYQLIFQPAQRSFFEKESQHYKASCVETWVKDHLTAPELCQMFVQVYGQRFIQLCKKIHDMDVDPSLLSFGLWVEKTAFCPCLFVLIHWYLALHQKQLSLYQDMDLFRRLLIYPTDDEFCRSLPSLIQDIQKEKDFYLYLIEIYPDLHVIEKQKKETIKEPISPKKLSSTESFLEQASQEFQHHIYETYLNSLAERERTLITGMKAKISSALFAKQLKPRLIQFMTDHPHTWSAH